MTRNEYPSLPESHERSYTIAASVAANNIMQAPTGFPILQGIYGHGEDLYYARLEFSKNSSNYIDVPLWDMPVETDEITQTEDPYIPLNIKMQEGEFLNIMNPLDAGKEIRLYFRFTKAPWGEQMRIARHTYTNTTAPPIPFVPALALDDIIEMRGYLNRGVDLEGTEIAFGGGRQSWYIGVDGSALNNIQVPPQIWNKTKKGIANMEILATECHRGTGGASELFILYRPKAVRG